VPPSSEPLKSCEPSRLAWHLLPPAWPQGSREGRWCWIMSEPRHLEFLEELLRQLQEAAPDVRAVRELATAALAQELELVEGSGPGVPGASGARPGGRVPGAARVASRAPRSQPDPRLQVMASEMKNALNKWMTFELLPESLRQLARQDRGQLLDARLLAALQGLGPAQRTAVDSWWQDMKRLRSESKRLRPGGSVEPPRESERQRRGRSRTRTRDAPLERGRGGEVPMEALDGSWSRYRPSSQVPAVSGVPGVPARKDPRWAASPTVIEIHSMPEERPVPHDCRHKATLTLTCHQLRSDETKRLKHHNGTHPQMLAAAACHSELGGLVRAVQDFLREEGAWVDGVGDGVPGGLGRTRGSVWGIRLMCSSGRHRSVSLAELLRVFLCRQGLPSTTTHHGLQLSTAPCDRPQGCQECNKRPTVRDVEEVRRHWDA